MTARLLECVLYGCLCLLLLVPVGAEVNFSVAERARIERHGPWPVTLPPDPGNEYSGLQWAESTGRFLFHDTGLSADDTLSCASCHQMENGFNDRLTVAGGNQLHTRNTMSLLNAGLQRWFGWNGGSDSLWAATLRPMLSEIEMGGSVSSIADYLRGESGNADAWSAISARAGIKLSAIPDEVLVVIAAKMIAA